MVGHLVWENPHDQPEIRARRSEVVAELHPGNALWVESFATNGSTIIAATGAHVRLLGVTRGTFSQFTEVVPLPIQVVHFKLA
jgi:hypothetical protein